MDENLEKAIHRIQGAQGHIDNILDGTTRATTQRLEESLALLSEAMDLLRVMDKEMDKR